MGDTRNEVIEEKVSDLSLVLLGKTGAGKSAAGNTILGREAFKSKKSPKSVTQDVAVESGYVDGLSVTVYDTPGYCDTDLTEEEIQLKYQSTFQKCSSGRFVFLLVIKADRFTEEERKTVEKIEQLLGQNRLEKTWILFTRGDELEEENTTIQEFIEETEALKTLVQKYEHRYYLFNNKKRGVREQVRALFTRFFKKSINKANKLNSLKRKKPKPVPRVSGVPSRRIVLVGKTGVGKSAAGNTILGQKNFKSTHCSNSVTRKCSVKQSTVSGRSVSVVDTPGLFDTKMKPEELMMEMARSVYISSPGPHAFLIVFPVNMRFTEQELQIPLMIELMFGEEVLKYSIILFTHGDLLDGKTIEKFIQENCALRSLVQRCGGRYHVFNNRDVKNREQVEDLLQKIDSMIQQNGGGHYTNQMYEDAQRARQEEEEERQKTEREKQREKEEKRQREEEDKKINEKQRQEEIQRVRKETEERLRKEIEVEQNLKLDIFNAQMQKEEIKVQRVDETVETDETTSAEGENQLKSEQENTMQTSSGFSGFFQKYRKCFYVCAVALGFIAGACLVAGAVYGGAALFGAAFCDAVFRGAVVGGFAGAVGGGLAFKRYEKRLEASSNKSQDNPKN